MSSQLGASFLGGLARLSRCFRQLRPLSPCRHDAELMSLAPLRLTEIARNVASNSHAELVLDGVGSLTALVRTSAAVALLSAVTYPHILIGLFVYRALGYGRIGASILCSRSASICLT
jgi:hypothetical protein